MEVKLYDTGAELISIPNNEQSGLLLFFILIATSDFYKISYALN